METVMEGAIIAELTSRFQALAALVPLRPIRTDEDYDKAVAMLNQLLEAGAGDEKNPLHDLLNKCCVIIVLSKFRHIFLRRRTQMHQIDCCSALTIGSLIAEYDDDHYPQIPVSPVDTLRFLMEQHHVSGAGLPEIGNRHMVDEVLAGKRELDMQQIRALAQRFSVPASVFV